MKIYGDAQSGNCFKIKLVCELLKLDYQWVHINLLAGETKTDGFLAMNPNGKIPLLELDDGRYLSESNAIINYLASGSHLLPDDVFETAKVQQWQFFEQYSHEPYIAVARFIAKYLGLPEDKKAEFESKQEGGHKALRVMENQLQQTPWLTGQTMTTADISLYAYTHVAADGGFDLNHYPAITRWLRAIQSLPEYVGLEA